MSIKIGIVGAGGMAGYHVAGFRKSGAEIVALADVNKAAADRAAAKHGIGRVFKSLSEMLRRAPEINAVSIIVPNKFHAQLALQALRAGKHVFCEKPPSVNAREMAELRKAASKARRVLMFNFNNRARPESYAMMDYISAGTVGTINSCQAKWARRAGIPGFGGWFTTKALSGGGPLIDLLHMMDLGLYFMGYPEPAHLLARTYRDHIDNKAFKGPWGIADVPNGVTRRPAGSCGDSSASTASTRRQATRASCTRSSMAAWSTAASWFQPTRRWDGFAPRRISCARSRARRSRSIPRIRL